MIAFFQKFLKAVLDLRPYVVALIVVVAFIQLFVSSSAGGADRRQTILNIIGLLLFATAIMYIEEILGFFNINIR